MCPTSTVDGGALAWNVIGAWRSYLADVLWYSAAQISQPSLLDPLKVYRDRAKSQCLAVIAPEVSLPADEDRALLELANRIGAEFVVRGSPQAYKIYHVTPYGLIRSATKRLPSRISGLSRSEFLSKDHVLLPFRDEAQLRRALGACHDMIYKETASDPAASFDLLSLVIAAKVMDEQRDAQHYYFSAISGEEPEQAATRLAKLLQDAREWLAGDNIHEIALVPVQRLRGAVAGTVFRELQDFSLTLTGDSPAGTDILGVAYEHLVGSTFRGELRSYFTPRNVADFIVRLLGAQQGRIFDPSCGSAGLLVAALRYWRSGHGTAEPPQLFGNDINPRMGKRSGPPSRVAGGGAVL